MAEFEVDVGLRYLINAVKGKKISIFLQIWTKKCVYYITAYLHLVWHNPSMPNYASECTWGGLWKVDIMIIHVYSNIVLVDNDVKSPLPHRPCHVWKPLLLKYEWVKNLWSLELYDRTTGTCFIQKIYASSSSLLQGKYLPFTLSHFASIFFAYLWSFRWPNYIVTLPRYFSFRLPHLNITTGPLSNELDKNISERRIFYFSVTETDSHFRAILNWFRN